MVLASLMTRLSFLDVDNAGYVGDDMHFELNASIPESEGEMASEFMRNYIAARFVGAAPGCAGREHLSRGGVFR